ncbi:tRNA (adenosine(37)-N6)-threonylcarbamoyltransferase complex dimerization subunit type 1 TsaB [Candidatus Gottesmanbacteria bacterium]|nr:tRNA (adenosine(37)-N6)-threonylcarbamoyltransferase complex dimerization subunit type 1 TsaB [Candidatus Gottesmanbacteria bacterium]
MKKSPVILSIDTSDSKKVKLTLLLKGSQFSKITENNWISQSLLPAIEALLSENNIKITDLTEITVHTGPGSYTGLRVGISVANTLSYLLKIPINGKKDRLVIPDY